MKDILHSILFPNKHIEIQNFRNVVIPGLNSKINLLEEIVDSIKSEEYAKNTASMEDVVRKSLGLPSINFVDLEDDGRGNDRPPHFLKGLDSQSRQTFISELSQIYKNDKFKTVMEYHINDLGNYSLQVATDENMKNGRIGIIAFRKFRKHFEDAHAEYLESIENDNENFDRHSIMPE